jgi:hypothetical protein
LSSGVDDDGEYPGKTGVIFEDSGNKKHLRHQLARTYNGFKHKKGITPKKALNNTDKTKSSPGGGIGGTQ